MEPVFKCSKCNFIGTKSEVQAHEKNCNWGTNKLNDIAHMNKPSCFFNGDFEIRKSNDDFTTNDYKVRYPVVYEIVKWYNTEKPIKVYSPISDKEVERSRFCYVVAFIKWDNKESAWEFDCVGTRYITDYEHGMNAWVKDWIDYISAYNGSSLKIGGEYV